MKNPYSPEEARWLNELLGHYRAVINGICMVTVNAGADNSEDPCKGPIGRRHAIARRHLQLIADDDKKIRANKESESFATWSEQHNDLERVAISRFSAGKWSCQEHDQRFAGIDAQRIDLTEPENLFKAVYRVVLRQNHLMLARWHAHFVGTETEDGWEHFKKTAFETEVNDEEAANAESEWRDEAHAVMGKMRDLERRLAQRDWTSLEYRALLLESDPAVAGWGCLQKKIDLSRLPPDDPRRHWNRHVELGYMIVIPQQDGHAIITACEPDTRRFVRGISAVHNFIPPRENHNEPYRADDRLRLMISRRLWDLDEIGMRESLYQSWSATEQREVQAWMKNRRTRQRLHSSLPPSHLPSFC